MGCCAAWRGDQVASAAAPVLPAPAATASTAPRVRFEACASFVGTDQPAIAQDGEGPRRNVKLRAFALEPFAVTNARFAEFVTATGYVSEAERFGWSPVFRGLMPNGAQQPAVSPQIPWWARVKGACWHMPAGPGSSLEGRQDHPVVQVSWNDARAFATWAGGRLPTEAEWEHAARGELADPRFPWGDAEPDDTTIYCNIWQGRFPDQNLGVDGYIGTAPVNAFAPNGAGLYGMAGNVWEWVEDPFRVRSLGKAARQRNEAAARTNDRVAKGGSFLCHISYCYRYRIAARTSMSADSATSNTGFRVCYDI